MENALLIEYDGGWAGRTRESSIALYGRCEAFLSLGAVTSLDEVYRLADAHLDEFSVPRVQTDIGIDPAGDEDTPYLGWHGVGDTITINEEEHQVLAMTVSEDEETGEAEFVPTLNAAVVLNAQERIAQAIAKMIPGSRGGRAKIASLSLPGARRGRIPTLPGLLTERFDKADSVGWDFDQVWSPIALYGGNPATDSGEAALEPIFFFAGQMIDTPLTGLDQYAQVEVTTWTVDCAVGLLLRGDGDVPGLMLLYGDSGTSQDWALFGPSGLIIGPSAAGISVGIGDVVRAEIEWFPGVGTEVRGYVNGTLDFINSGMSGVQRGYKVGLQLSISNPPLGEVRADNFEAGLL